MSQLAPALSPAPAPMPTDSLLAAVRVVPDFPSAGIRFLDVTPVLASRAHADDALDRLAAPWRDAGITHVAAVEARGFWFGGGLAERLGAGLIPVRKPGKLPAATLREAYDLEYGADAVELHADAFEAHGAPRVLLHDDVLATGGTAGAVCRLLVRAGAEVVGCSFLIEIAALGGRAALPAGLRVEAVLQG